MRLTKTGCLFSFCLFLISTSCFQSERDLIGKMVFVKHNLIFIAEPPLVYPDQIIFQKKTTNCHEQLWAFVIGRGAEVKIKKITHTKGLALFTIEAGEYGDVEIALFKSTLGSYVGSFKNIFSMDPCESDNPIHEFESESDLIDCLGYPIYKCPGEDGTIIYYYNERFVGSRIHGFHDVWFKIRQGKIVGEYGLI